MRAVSAITSSFRTYLGPERRRAARKAAPKPECRALVPLRTAPSTEGRRHHLPSAAFLAHLIATKGQAPQTRLRRRGEPAEAATAYGHRLEPADAGRTLSRKM